MTSIWDWVVQLSLSIRCRVWRAAELQSPFWHIDILDSPLPAELRHGRASTSGCHEVLMTGRRSQNGQYEFRESVFGSEFTMQCVISDSPTSFWRTPGMFQFTYAPSTDTRARFMILNSWADEWPVISESVCLVFTLVLPAAWHAFLTAQPEKGSSGFHQITGHALLCFSKTVS